MADKKLEHINRQFTEEERQRYAKIREDAKKEFPPISPTGQEPSPPGIPTKIRETRESQGLTWYALAQLSGIPNSDLIRDIEKGKDVKLSSLEAVASALGLKLELVNSVK